MTKFAPIIKKAFGPINDQELRTLSDLTRTHTYPAGHIIIREGATEHTFYIITEGEVVITKEAGAGDQPILVERKAGEFFGEMALLENKPRSATVVAVTETTVIEITKDVFHQLLRQSPNLAFIVMERIAAMLRVSSVRLVHENVRLKTLYEIAQALNSTLELEEVLNLMMDKIMETTRARRGFLVLLDDLQLHFSIGRNIDRQTFDSSDFARYRNLVSEAITTRRPLLAGAETHCDLATTAPEKISRHQHASIVLPLISNDATLGAIYVDNHYPNQTFATDDPDLLMALAHQAATAVRNAQMVEQIKEAERHKRELEVASRIQLSLLPCDPPKIARVQLAARLVQAQNVGGDCYDYFVDETGQLNFFILDATGHGVGSALFAATTRSILLVEGGRDTTPAQVFRRANTTIYEDACRASLFLTGFYARFDPVTRRLTYTNAGHPPPVVWQSAAGRLRPLDTDGLPLGVLEDYDYPQGETTLAPNDVIVLYTDGFIEARNQARQQLGEEVLHQIIADHHAEPGEAIIERVFAAVDAHRGPRPQQDDLTIIVMHIS